MNESEKLTRAAVKACEEYAHHSALSHAEIPPELREVLKAGLALLSHKTVKV